MTTTNSARPAEEGETVHVRTDMFEDRTGVTVMHTVIRITQEEHSLAKVCEHCTNKEARNGKPATDGVG